jgi:hypothetical protein
MSDFTPIPAIDVFIAALGAHIILFDDVTQPTRMDGRNTSPASRIVHHRAALHAALPTRGELCSELRLSGCNLRSYEGPASEVNYKLPTSAFHPLQQGK